MQDQWGNPIAITVSVNGSPWIFTRAIDGLVVTQPGTLSQAAAQAAALSTFNAMIPPTDYVPVGFVDVNGFIGALFVAAGSNNALLQALGTYAPTVQMFVNTGRTDLLASHWNALVASPPSWLTTGVKNTIISTAAQYNISI
jgi:hypothetical protein